MLRIIKLYFLEIIVFICGAAVMIFELVGSRIMAPYFGTSLFVWTSIIGIILGSLSLGYWWGGRIADKKPTIKILSFIILLSGLSIGGVGYTKDMVCAFFEHIIPDTKWAALGSAFVLFTIPSTLLGMISPFAAKLKLHTLSNSGSAIGSLYALSTIGSIVGTFCAGFLLIPTWGSTSILFSIALTLTVLSLILASEYITKTKIAATLIFTATIFILPTIYRYFEKYGLIIKDTAYNAVRIYTTQDPRSKKEIQILKINNEFSSAQFIASEDLVFDYTKFYHLAEHFNPGFKAALMLGGAGYSYPKTFLKKFPEKNLDVVEIDQGITEIAKKYFHLIPNKKLRIYHEDGRAFINKTKNIYDVIYGDAFQSMSPPFQLTTEEAVQKYYNALSPNGVIIINIISAIEGDAGIFARAEVATFKKTFPHVLLFPVNHPEDGNKVQNIMLIGLKSISPPILTSKNPDTQNYLAHLWTKPIPNDLPILTDDFAPIDSYMDKILSKK